MYRQASSSTNPGSGQLIPQSLHSGVSAVLLRSASIIPVIMAIATSLHIEDCNRIRHILSCQAINTIEVKLLHAKAASPRHSHDLNDSASGRCFTSPSELILCMQPGHQAADLLARAR
jgi:hypothetical protein